MNNFHFLKMIFFLMNNCQFFGIDHSTDQKDLLTDQIIGVGVRDVCASKNGKERFFWRASPIPQLAKE